MTPEISEFSYGFALTNELVGWMHLRSAPIFPSLIEEGRKGGGYDVKLDQTGVPLFLQFKRAEHMVRRSAREFACVRQIEPTFDVPFFRFPVMEAWRSLQHELLLELDQAPNMVFYAAPRFHKLHEINAAWIGKSIADESIFVQPREIGVLSPASSHSVVYNNSSAYLCSEAGELRYFTADALQDKLKALIESRRDIPLRATISESLSILRKARDRLRTMLRVPTTAEALLMALDGPTATGPVDGENAQIRELADIAMRDFDSQLIFIQSTDD